MPVICSVPSLAGAGVSRALVVVGGVTVVVEAATSPLPDLVGCTFSFNCSLLCMM
jgi:hypothetical protein